MTPKRKLHHYDPAGLRLTMGGVDIPLDPDPRYIPDGVLTFEATLPVDNSPPWEAEQTPAQIVADLRVLCDTLFGPAPPAGPPPRGPVTMDPAEIRRLDAIVDGQRARPPVLVRVDMPSTAWNELREQYPPEPQGRTVGYMSGVEVRIDNDLARDCLRYTMSDGTSRIERLDRKG